MSGVCSSFRTGDSSSPIFLKGCGHVTGPDKSRLAIFRPYPPQSCSELSTEKVTTDQITVHHGAAGATRVYGQVQNFLIFYKIFELFSNYLS